MRGGILQEDTASLNRKAGAQSSTREMKDGLEAKRQDVEGLIRGPEKIVLGIFLVSEDNYI